MNVGTRVGLGLVVGIACAARAEVGARVCLQELGFPGVGGGVPLVEAMAMPALLANPWLLSGNSGTNPAVDFLGTTDNVALVIRVNNEIAARFEPAGAGNAPNVIEGFQGNATTSGVIGAAIGGGGQASGASTGPNFVDDDFGTVAGGANNRAGDGAGTTSDKTFATVSGGLTNVASGQYAVIAGGTLNTASADYAVIGGGGWVNATAINATVGGGFLQQAEGEYSTIGGGSRNFVYPGASHGAVGGGGFNGVEQMFGTVAGGSENRATAAYATVCGGDLNLASGLNSFAGGGLYHVASGEKSAVCGGEWNLAQGDWSMIGGGEYHEALGDFSTIGGGSYNEAVGDYSTIPGGRDNYAGGAYSFAAGNRAKIDILHPGATLFAGGNAFTFKSAAANEFAARCTGGARFVSAINGSGSPTAGVVLAPGGGSWSSLSSKASKVNVETVNGRAVLDRLMSIPIATWSYAAQDSSVRHMGPMAEDFAQAFAVGESAERITSVDADGVALAAIQGLHQLVREKDEKIASLEARLAALEEAMKRAK